MFIYKTCQNTSIIFFYLISSQVMYKSRVLEYRVLSMWQTLLGSVTEVINYTRKQSANSDTFFRYIKIKTYLLHFPWASIHFPPLATCSLSLAVNLRAFIELPEQGWVISFCYLQTYTKLLPNCYQTVTSIVIRQKIVLGTIVLTWGRSVFILCILIDMKYY